MKHSLIPYNKIKTWLAKRYPHDQDKRLRIQNAAYSRYMMWYANPPKKFRHFYAGTTWR